MSDPRNFVTSSPFSCERERGRYHLHGAWADWPEVVAFARAILAADEAWKDSQTPTLEELRAKYPNMVLTCQRVEQSYGAAISTRSLAFAYWPHSLICQEVNLPTEKAAIRWLAAKLEEVAPVETEQQFRECPACDGRGGIARQVSEDEWYHSPCEVCEGRGEVPVEELA